MESRRRRNERWFQFAMVCFTLLGIFTYVELYLLRRPPSIDYEVRVSPPSDVFYCPGDMLDYESTFRVTAPPTIVTVARSLWEIDEERTPVRDVGDDQRRIAIYSSGLLVNPLGGYTVPNVPAGSYRLDVVAHGADERVAGFSMEFHVGNCQ